MSIDGSTWIGLNLSMFSHQLRSQREADRLRFNDSSTLQVM